MTSRLIRSSRAVSQPSDRLLVAMTAVWLVTLFAPGESLAAPDAVNTPSTFVTTLSDNTIDTFLFGPSITRPWMVFMYSPWCPHCKTHKPVFMNASMYLHHSFSHRADVQGSASIPAGFPFAHFGVTDVTANKQLYHRFHIKAYPTVIYTTATKVASVAERRWYQYEGSFAMEDFISFAMFLYRGVERGSFVDDVTHPNSFSELVASASVARVTFIVFLPAGNTTREGKARNRSKHAVGWRDVINGLLSVGNTRYAFIEESRLPPNWESFASDAFKTVVGVARGYQQSPRASSPDGAVLVSLSDRFSSPVVYRGLWTDQSNFKTEPYHPHREMVDFISECGFLAVEEVSSATFSGLTSQDNTLLGVYITSEVLPPLKDTNNVYATLRQVVQTGSTIKGGTHPVFTSGTVPPKGSRPLKVELAVMHSDTYPQWREHYLVPAEELPTFIVVDTRRDKVFRMSAKDEALFAIEKHQLPWASNGGARAIIERFIVEVLEGRVRGMKVTMTGKVAEIILNIPGMEYFYGLVAYEDTLLVTMFGAAVFFILFTCVSLWIDPATPPTTSERIKPLPASRRKTGGALPAISSPLQDAEAVAKKKA